MTDKNDGNWNGVEKVFGEDSLSRVVSCKLHLLQTQNTHQNKICKLKTPIKTKFANSKHSSKQNLQTQNTHQNKMWNDTDKGRVTSLTNKLFEVKTHAGYMTASSMWVGDISTVL